MNIWGSGKYDIEATIGITGTEKFTNDLEKASAETDKSASRMNLALNMAFAAAGAALYAVSTAAAEFGSIMRNVSTLVDDEAMPAFERLKAETLELSYTLPNTAVALSDALYQVVSATVPVEKSLMMLEASAKGASAGVADTTETFNFFSAVIKGYGYEWEEVGRISDITFQTIKLGQTTMAELSTELGKTIPLASALGIRFEEVAGVLATLTGVTGNTAEVTTQMESLMTAFIKTKDEMGRFFDELGVGSGKDFIQKVGGLQGALQAMADYTNKYEMSIGDLLGRKEGIVAFYALTGHLSDDLAEKTAAMYSSMGMTERAFGLQMDGLGKQSQIFKNIVTGAFISIGTEVNSQMKKVFYLLNQYPGLIQGVVTGITKMTVALGALAVSVKAFQGLSYLRLQLLTAPWAPIAIAIGTVTTAVIALYTASKVLEQKRTEAITSIGDEYFALKDLEASYNIIKASYERTGLNQEALEKTTSALKDAYEKLGYKVSDADLAFGNLSSTLQQQKIDEVRDKIEEVNKKLENTANVSNSAGVGFGALTTNMANNQYTTALKDELNLLNAELLELEGGSKVAKDAQEALEKVMGTSTLTDKEKRKALEELLPKLESQPELFKQAVTEIGNLTEKINNNVPSVKTQAEQLKILAEKGIDTTDSIIAQIKEWENYRGVVSGDNFAISQIDDKILELNKTLVDSGVYTEAWRLSIGSLGGDLNTGLNPKLNDTIGHMEKGLKTFPNVQGGLEGINDEIKAKVGNWIDYSNFLGNVIDQFNFFGEGKGADAVKGGLNIVTTALGQLKELGIDPTKASLNTMLGALDLTSLGLMAAGTILNLLAGTGGTVSIANREIEEMGGTLKELYQQTIDAKNAFESLNSSFKSDALEAMRETQERLADMIDYLERVPGGVTKLSDVYKRMKEELAATNEEILRLTAPFTQMREMEEAQSALEYVLEQYAKYQEMFGEAADTSAIEALVREQINRLEVMRSKLDPTSAAYAELTEQIENADRVLAGLPPLIKDATEATEDNSEAVKTWNSVWQEMASSLMAGFKDAFSEFDEFMSSADQAKEMMSKMTYFNVDLNTTNADEAVAQLMAKWAAYLQTLDRNSPAFREGLAAFQELRQQYMGLTESTNNAGIMANEFGNDMQGLVSPTNDVVNATNELNEALENTTPEIEGQAEATKTLVDALHDQNYEINKLNLSYRDMDVFFGNVTDQFDEYMSSLGRFGKEGFEGTGEMFDVLDRLEQFNINFAETNVDEQLGQYILQMREFLNTLDPQSEAYQQLSMAIDSFTTRFEAMGGVIPGALDDTSDLTDVLDDYADQLQAANEATLDPPISDAFVEQADNTLTYLKNEYDKFLGDSITPAKQAIEDSFAIFNPAAIEAQEIQSGMDDVVNGFDLMGDSVSIVNQYLDEMRDKILAMPIIPTPPLEGGGILHGGGYPTAHSGFLNRGDEVWIKALKKEMVLSPRVTEKFGHGRLLEFNRTLNPDVLGGRHAAGGDTRVVVEVNEANPQTWVKVTQDKIYPHIKNLQRNYEAEGNPYR